MIEIFAVLAFIGLMHFIHAARHPAQPARAPYRGRLRKKFARQRQEWLRAHRERCLERMAAKYDQMWFEYAP